MPPPASFQNDAPRGPAYHTHQPGKGQPDFDPDLTAAQQQKSSRNKQALNQKQNTMKSKSIAVLNQLLLSLLMAAIPAVYAQSSPDQFTGEPNKSLAAAHESFLKKDLNASAAQIHKASNYVKKESDQVAQDSKAGMTKAGAELDKLGAGVKAGTVKSEAEMKQTFAKVNHQMATCWHQTAAESKQAGKDANADLKKAGASLAASAKWSGNQLNAGAQASVDALKKAGKATDAGVKAGGEEVDKWFKGIGDGIKDLGAKL